MFKNIAINLESGRDKENATLAIYNHIEKFWPRQLKLWLIEDIENLGKQLPPAALAAAKFLKTKYTPSNYTD